MRLAVLMVLVAQVVACGSTPTPPPSQPGESSLAGAGDPSLPATIHALQGAPQEDAARIETKALAVSVDGAKVADVAPAADKAKKPARVEGLYRALVARSETWKKSHPGEPFPGRAAFTFEPDAPTSVVKTVIFTAAAAGHASVALLARVSVENGGLVPGYLNADARTVEAPKGERELHVSLSSRGVVILKWVEGGKTLGELIPSDVQVAKLATTIERGWNERGQHREPHDTHFDQAVLHVENDTPYALLVVTLDALHATKRKLAVGGSETQVPALHVNLVSD